MSLYDPLRPAYHRPAPGWRWLSELVWRLEHAFERARADARPEEDTRVRIFVILALFSAVFAALAVGAAHAALLAPRGGVGAAAQTRVLTRGDLTDREGRLLATNITHYGLYINAPEVWDREAAFRRIRAALPRVSAARLRRALYGQGRSVVINGLNPHERAAIHALGLGGVTFAAEDKRAYPLGSSAVHLIGLADAGGRGVSGAELAFDAEVRAAGADGGGFPLSIDLRVQGVLENELATAAAETGAKGAVGIIADVHTGEVLGLASWPAFDGNRPGAAARGADLNRAASAHYEMGSVFKSFTVAAGLDTGRADMGTLFDASQPLMVNGRRITDFHGQNRIMTLEEVFLRSSNIGTSRLAIEMGPDVMRSYFQNLGLLDAAPIELKESARPMRPRRWDDSTLASLSFGYGIMATPLQVSAAMGALANGGRYVPLSLRRGGAANAQPRQAVSEATSRDMLHLLRSNVARGSGARAEAPGLRVGGKTGSANKLVNGRYDPATAVGVFAGVFPSDGPVTARRYSILILIDEPSTYPRTGGFVAAPAAGRVAHRVAPFLGLERRDDPWRTAQGDRQPVIEEVQGDGVHALGTGGAGAGMGTGMGGR